MGKGSAGVKATTDKTARKNGQTIADLLTRSVVCLLAFTRAKVKAAFGLAYYGTCSRKLPATDWADKSNSIRDRRTKTLDRAKASSVSLEFEYPATVFTCLDGLNYSLAVD